LATYITFAALAEAMKYYFLLQFKMLNRQVAEYGISPALGYILSIAAFIGFSVLLFNKTDYAEYIYIAGGLSLIQRLSEPGRNQFIKTCFPGSDHYKVRIIENMIIILPFLVFLLFKLLFIHALLFLAIAMLMALMTFGSKSGLVVPTPFGKKPFEFTVGFRYSFLVFILAYFLAVMAIVTGNFNLGIAALILVFLVCYTFYLNPEHEFFVWIFNQSPARFLSAKIKTALIYSSFLSVPVSLLLIIAYPDKLPVVAIFQALGYVFLTTVILAKYASFPHQIALPQFVILAVSAWFPPLLVAAIPFFYLRSVNRLKELLV